MSTGTYDSILQTIKKMLGIEYSDTAFDTDIVIYTNSAINILEQNGVVPEEGFHITGATETWDAIVNDDNYSMVKDYIYLYVRTVFDPPSNSFVMEEMKARREELLIRLNMQASYDGLA